METAAAHRAPRHRIRGDLAAGADELTVRPTDACRQFARSASPAVRDEIHNFNTDGFDSLYLKCKGGRPKKFTLSGRREIKKIAKSTPTERDLPFSTRSLSKLAEFLVVEGVESRYWE